MPCTYALTIATMPASRRAARLQRVDLVGEERLGLRARHERLAGQREPERVEPGTSSAATRAGPRISESSRPRSAAVTQPAPYATFGLGLAEDVRRRRSGRARSSRRPRPLDRHRLLLAEAERLGLESALDVGLRDLATQWRQRVVELRLVGRVLVEGEAAVLAGRQDAVRLRGVVRRARQRRRSRGERRKRRRDRRGGRAQPPTADDASWRRTCTPHDAARSRPLVSDCAMNALLAFGAALVSLRLAAELVRRARRERSPELTAWAASLVAYAAAVGRLAAGAAGGWHDATFRVYYLFGGLLTAPLLGVGSLLRAGFRRAAPIGLVYSGLAIGVAVAMPLTGVVSGTGSRAPRATSSSFRRGCSRSQATRSGHSPSSPSRSRRCGVVRSGTP